ncbi:MAG: cytochrome b N-terminal domain-containing protein [Bradyrhizobiaceae bacterium]|nr:cytochrome b N-terminal domain-containing protein [Bradyrhizobiaceae bacterium]
MRSLLRNGFEFLERAADTIFGPRLNPIPQLGALGFFLFWIVAVSGIYLFIFFDTGVVDAYNSIESITHRQWFAGGVLRSFHRYASDLMVVVLVVHATREFALDRYRGAYWFSWFTGVPLIWLLYASGITGYWLVWDQLAQYVAIVSSELLDWLPIFGEPIARNFLTPASLNDRFFTLLIFMHIGIPLVLLFVMWVHILRISRPNMNPPRALAVVVLISLVIVSFWKPAQSQGSADLAAIPNDVGLDWFYLPLYPLADLWSHGAVWALLGGFTLMLLAMPWLPPLRRPRPVEVNLAHCNGCGRCVEDCPHEAVRMVPRADGRPFIQQAQVNSAACVSCGICVGSCPSSTPFRRSAELETGIDLPDLPLRELRRQTEAAAAELSGPVRVLTFACAHSAAGVQQKHTVKVPCIATVPPSLIDYVVSRNLADGVVVAGCAERAGYHRLGVAWMQGRLAGERDPRLRARVQRERICSIWASRSEQSRFGAEVKRFTAALGSLGPNKGLSPRTDGGAESAAKAESLHEEVVS